MSYKVIFIKNQTHVKIAKLICVLNFLYRGHCVQGRLLHLSGFGSKPVKAVVLHLYFTAFGPQIMPNRVVLLVIVIIKATILIIFGTLARLWLKGRMLSIMIDSRGSSLGLDSRLM